MNRVFYINPRIITSSATAIPNQSTMSAVKVLSLTSTIHVLIVVCSLAIANSYRLAPSSLPFRDQMTMKSTNYLEDLSLFKSEKKVLVGFTTDAWNIGQKKYKEFLAVNKMVKRINKSNLACIEVPMWEAVSGPHYDELQRLLESFWVPDMTSKENLLLQFDLVIIPDPTLAKYLVEAFYEKEMKVEKKKAYYSKLVKQPWGVVDAYPPKERLEWERIKNLSKQKWIRKFPPLAALGQDTYKRLKNHAQVEYFAHGVEDFALHLPAQLVPSHRVLVLRYKNRFDTLVQSLVMRGISVTSAYPITWTKKEWNPQEERMAKEVDVVYFHDPYAVREWVSRLGTGAYQRRNTLNKATELAENLMAASKGVPPGPKSSASESELNSSSRTSSSGTSSAGTLEQRGATIPVACHDEEVAKVAKACGFKDIFYAKKSDADGLTRTVMEAVECAKAQHSSPSP